VWEAGGSEETRGGRARDLAGVEVFHEGAEGGVVSVDQRDLQLEGLTVAVGEHGTKSADMRGAATGEGTPVAHQTEEDAVPEYPSLLPGSVSGEEEDDVAQFFGVEERSELALGTERGGESDKRKRGGGGDGGEVT
jgi:hypothetical protein